MLLLLKSDIPEADAWLFRKGLKNVMYLSTKSCGFGQIKKTSIHIPFLFVFLLKNNLSFGFMSHWDSCMSGQFSSSKHKPPTSFY